MLKPFTSRKFIVAAAAFIALILSTAGVIDQATEVQTAEALTLIAYIFANVYQKGFLPGNAFDVK